METATFNDSDRGSSHTFECVSPVLPNSRVNYYRWDFLYLLCEVIDVQYKGVIPGEAFISRPCQTDGLTEGK